jgi:hypothetical protein
MTGQLRLIEITPRTSQRDIQKLNVKTRDLGRKGVADARAALANARLLPEIDLDAA